MWLDGGSKGEGKGKERIERNLGWSAEVVQHLPKVRGVWARPEQVINWAELLPPSGFRMLPRRRVVERTFSWCVQSRRFGKDYERLHKTSETTIYAAMTRLIVKRFSRS